MALLILLISRGCIDAGAGSSPGKISVLIKCILKLGCTLISDPRLNAMHLEHLHSRPARLVVSVAGLSKPYLVLYMAEFEEGDIMGVGKIRAAPPCNDFLNTIVRPTLSMV